VCRTVCVCESVCVWVCVTISCSCLLLFAIQPRLDLSLILAAEMKIVFQSHSCLLPFANVPITILIVVVVVVVVLLYIL